MSTPHSGSEPWLNRRNAGRPVQEPEGPDFWAVFSEFKGWSDVPLAVPPEIFENIIEIAGRKGKLRILEIGFGDGAFMDWARAEGHVIIGTEIRADAVAAAQARGHQAHLGMPSIKPVDLIVALDVIEHLTSAQLLDLLEAAHLLLLPGGAIVARFPNASSPFFGHHHYGDMTHDQPRTVDALRQITTLKRFDVLRAVNPRPRPRGLVRAAKIRLSYCFRDLIEIVLGYAYFGTRIPMDPNVVTVLERSGGPHAPASDGTWVT